MTKKEVVIGTMAIYWEVISEDGSRSGPEKTVILSEPWEASGQTICKILGKVGGVSIKHLDTITPGSLMAAKLSGLNDISNEELAEATKKFFADHGVNIANLKIR